MDELATIISILSDQVALNSIMVNASPGGAAGAFLAERIRNNVQGLVQALHAVGVEEAAANRPAPEPQPEPTAQPAEQQQPPAEQQAAPPA